jgi:hypothetical protein
MTIIFLFYRPSDKQAMLLLQENYDLEKEFYNL